MSIYKTHLKIEHLVDIPDITRQGAEITENVLDTDVMLGVTWGTDAVGDIAQHWHHLFLWSSYKGNGKIMNYLPHTTIIMCSCLF